MTELNLNQEKIFLDVISHKYHNKIKTVVLYEKNIDHLVVFCGKGLTDNLCDSINQIAFLLRDTNTIIGITDRGDLKNRKLSSYVHKIPLYIDEKNVPKGIKAENYLFCEIKSISKYIENLEKTNIKFFTRIRKDIYLNVLQFVDYLQSVPSLENRYKFITVNESTNLLRRFCISDMFFTIPISFINKLPYRLIPESDKRFWINYRHIKPHEIFKNDYQMEQWVWINLLKDISPNLKIDCSLRDYWEFIHQNILVITPKQIGYIWNRSSDSYLNNWVRYAPNGNGLFSTTKPIRDFFSYDFINSNLLIRRTKLARYFINIRKEIFLKKFFYFLITFPFYFLKHLLESSID